jgi:outer membrane protein TolC
MAEGQMHVASAQIGIATAALLPSINLAGNDGHAANDTATLTDATQRAWAGVGEVDVPIFQGGQLWFTRQAAKQAYQSAWLNYRLVVLTAFEQVEDAFSVLDQDQIGYASAAASKESAQALATAANAQFKAGVMSATEQEQAQINYLNACMVEIDKRVQLLQDVTMLSVALGGVEFQ